MTTYFNLRGPFSEHLLADGSQSAPGVKAQKEIIRCIVNREHIDRRRRVSPLFLQVKHDRRDEEMIWSWGDGYVVHEQLLAEFEQQGFKGYRTGPATVQFGDGSISDLYREFIVTGWAGVAPPESGIRVVESCPGCYWKRYSPIANYEKLIDWSQWTGDDFFIVWPMPLLTLITSRVAQWLLSHNVKSFHLQGFEDRPPLITSLGFTVGKLSEFLPEDLAIKYGGPLGIE